MKSTKLRPLPWTWEGDVKKKMSAVLDFKGHVVCGSLICSQSDKALIASHQAIVKAINTQFCPI